MLLYAFADCTGNSSLEQNWERIKNDTRPWVIYYWVNGNFDKEGITKDIEAAVSAGIGGIFVLDVHQHLPDTGPKFNSPPWREMVEHAAKEAEKHNMLFGMQPAAGWSGMGGPWVPITDAMKELTWSVTPHRGGDPDVPTLKNPIAHHNYYEDIAVLAIPGKGAQNLSDTVELLSSSSIEPEAFDLLRDGFADADYQLPNESRLDFKLSSEEAITALRFRLPRLNYDRINDSYGRLLVSLDGLEWKEAKTFSFRWNMSAPEVRDNTIQNSITVTLPKGDYPYLRIESVYEGKTKTIPLAEIEFLTGPHIDRREAKAALLMDRIHDAGFDEINTRTEAISEVEALDANSIIDVTEYLGEDGVLSWDAPEGDWRLLRIGYTVTGRSKGVTREGGKGLLIDVMNKGALERHLDAYFSTLIEPGAPLNDGRMQIFHSDSWEEFHQNWAVDFREAFQQMRGYDCLPYLTVITGEAVIESAEISERFLWDFRRTLADLMIERYFLAKDEWAHQRGLIVHSDYAGRQQWLSDPVRFQTATDIPIGEFWLFQNRLRPDVKMAASAANVKGTRLVSAEAFTDLGRNDGWTTRPERFKSLGDRAMTEGVNRFNFHTYTAQPDNIKPPGITLGRWGSILSRYRLWWKEFGSEWHSYIERACRLLQEGDFRADVLLIASDGAPSETGNSEDFDVPEGYGFDVGASKLLQNARVEDGEVVLASGMRYELVSLMSDMQSPDAMRSIRRLINDGATIHARHPLHAPGLSGYPLSDSDVSAIWNLLTDYSTDSASTKQGRLFSNGSVADVLKALELPPQMESDSPQLHFIARELGDTVTYFVANRSSETIETELHFRVGHARPVLYDAVSDSIREIPYYTRESGKILSIPLRFDSLDSIFIRFIPDSTDSPITEVRQGLEPYDYYHPVTDQTSYGKLLITKLDDSWVAASKEDQSFSVDSSNAEYEIPVAEIESIPISQPWTLDFQSPFAVEPPTMIVDKLFDWSKSSDTGIRYFSGTATYTTDFVWDAYEKAVLDLGNVGDHAIVRLNDIEVGRLWKSPFRIDVTNFLRPGKNELVIEVTNALRNRLIGDDRIAAPQLKFDRSGRLLNKVFPSSVFSDEDPEVRQTFASYRHVDSKSLLAPSGLIGPVILEVIK